MPVLTDKQVISKQIIFIMGCLLRLGIPAETKLISVNFEHKYAKGMIEGEIICKPIQPKIDEDVMLDILEFSRIIFRYRKFKTLNLTYTIDNDEVDVKINFKTK